MQPNTLFNLFDPCTLGWLHRHHKNGDEITAADLDRLLEADPANGSDSIMIHYLREHLAGRLKRKRGRKPPDPMHWFKLQMADVLIEDRAQEIKAERKGKDRNCLRAELDPSVQAANEAGRWLGLPTGRSLLNAISAFKRRGFVVRESAPAS